MSGIPILVDASSVRVLVVGGGPVAVRKARLFANAGAIVRVVAREPSDDMRAVALEHRILLALRDYDRVDIGDAELVIAATNDRDVNAAIASDARAAHRLVNVVDAPDEGSFATMAVHREGTLAIGVSAGGVPTAASRIRDAIAERFDARYAEAIDALSVRRRQLLADDEGPEWRRLSAALLDERFCESVEQGTLWERTSAWR